MFKRITINRYRPGCPYFLPAAECVKFQDDKGCIAAVETWVMEEFLPILDSVRILFIVNIFIGTISCCLMMKRKEHDVLPTSYVVHHRPKKDVLEKG